jgi:hypothetical protein
LSYNHYSRKYFILVYGKSVVMVTFATGVMFLLFTCVQFWTWGILRRWSTYAPTACNVVRYCRKFGEHCINRSSRRYCAEYHLIAARIINVTFIHSFTHVYSPGWTLGPLFRGFLITYRHTAGLLWTSDQPVAETSTYTGQHDI